MTWTVGASVVTFVLGAVLTYVIHASTQHQAFALSVAGRKIALRDDRREVIYAFIDEMQEIEKMLDREYRDLQAGRPSSITEADRLTRQHRMWFQQKRIEVVGSNGLIEKARNYALTMERLIFRDPPPEVLKAGYRIWMNADRRDANKAFLQQARNELYSPEIFEDEPERHSWRQRRSLNS
ncbi:hypothetical protein BTO20_28715 [Mycobacterium dioxanotrophicus]|uniref:Uncharacterized protein n=1 Tax=Mycobacterium dioxanotrophicus TaxID=482462 RepID=A0A1Y0CA65_9MYCO|nr:hypothetical protein [Mycobacterium dioxanotrophicus]ART72002.1 hypothetical protein BTO20_28715 [Mycobacterium dioxanotrophicus]